MGSNEARKKEREVLAVREALVRVLGVVGDVPVRSHEGPDAIATLPELGEVGVEVVEPVDQGVASGMAGLERIGDKLLARLNEAGHRVEVHLRTGGGFIAMLNDGKTLRRHVDGLDALVTEHVEASRTRGTYRREGLRKHGLDRLTRVTVGPAETPTVYTGAGVIGNGVLVSDAVQGAINAKNAKVDRYRAEMAHRPLWLLVLAGGSFAGGSVSEFVRGATYVSAFDRTLFMNAYDGAAFELSTKAKERS